MTVAGVASRLSLILCALFLARPAHAEVEPLVGKDESLSFCASNDDWSGAPLISTMFAWTPGPSNNYWGPDHVAYALMKRTGSQEFYKGKFYCQNLPREYGGSYQPERLEQFYQNYLGMRAQRQVVTTEQLRADDNHLYQTYKVLRDLDMQRLQADRQAAGLWGFCANPSSSMLYLSPVFQPARAADPEFKAKLDVFARQHRNRSGAHCSFYPTQEAAEAERMSRARSQMSATWGGVPGQALDWDVAEIVRPGSSTAPRAALAKTAEPQPVEDTKRQAQMEAARLEAERIAAEERRRQETEAAARAAEAAEREKVNALNRQVAEQANRMKAEQEAARLRQQEYERAQAEYKATIERQRADYERQLAEHARSVDACNAGDFSKCGGPPVMVKKDSIACKTVDRWTPIIPVPYFKREDALANTMQELAKSKAPNRNLQCTQPEGLNGWWKCSAEVYAGQQKICDPSRGSTQ